MIRAAAAVVLGLLVAACGGPPDGAQPGYVDIATGTQAPATSPAQDPGNSEDAGFPGSTGGGAPDTSGAGSATSGPHHSASGQAPGSTSGSGASHPGTRPSTSRPHTSAPHTSAPHTSAPHTSKPSTCGTAPSGQTDGRKNQAIVFRAFSAHMWPQNSVTLTACATSGLPVTFAFAQKYACSLDGSRLSIATPGWCEITASQAGNATFAAAPPVTQRYIVDSQVITISWRSPESLTVGKDAVVTLVATSPSGPVSAYMQITTSGRADAPCSGRVSERVPDGILKLTVTVAAEGACEISGVALGDQFVHGEDAPPLSIPISAA